MNATSANDRGRPTIVLIAVCLAVLTLPASLTGASVALPRIGVDLHAGYAPLQWVVNSYNLAFACSMLACGSAADIMGRKRLFVAGLALFSLSSAVSVLTSDIIVLDVVRALAGVGAAAVMTAGSAILATTFEGAAQARAFAILGSAAGAGLALGPSTAGLLVDTFGWRGVFASHLVVMVLVAAAVPMMRESRDPAAVRFDWPGIAAFTLGLLLLMLGVVQGPQWGWSSAGTVLLLAAATVLMTLFVVAELRQARPMFDLGLFGQPRFLAASLVPLSLSFGFVCLVVLLPAYLTGARGMSVGRAGYTMMLLTLPVLVVPLVVSNLVRRGVSTRLVLTLSMLVAAGGAAWLTIIDQDIAVVALIGPLFLIGTGMGMTAGLVDGLAITSVRPEQAGTAAGMFNTVRLASEAVAIAAMGALVLDVTRGRISAGLPGTPIPPGGADAAAIANKAVSGNPAGAADGLTGTSRTDFLDLLTHSYTHGFHVLLWVLVGIGAATAVVLNLLLRPREATTTVEQVEPVTVAVDA
ncbi:MFS transporter [Frankia sp. AgKG'84/4]|uniref:MFS transporter n=1 Tax=Frankia sp. AgKG'84/4 TaxID=573490 RepID=UPI002010B171|nr:MFS transporter [Frankia sp. AgKG'84/4]MCL9792924.1 MFS transporter [Frankia sp. AgKG'84/4]